MLTILFFSRTPGLHLKSCLCSNRYMPISMLMVSRLYTSSGLLLGRPFGGIDILWRKSIGDCIQIHKYNDSRVLAIEYNNGNRKLLAVNIYMPCDDRSTNNANYDEFIKYLGMMHSIINDCDISSVGLYIIGDWNAGFNGNSVFGTELSSFCLEHDYVLSDIDHLGALSGSFTVVSEVHGTTSCIDHCMCTTQAHANLVGVNIDYGMQSSDHSSLSICIDVKSVPRLERESVPTQSRLNWSKASARDKSAYTDKCAELLGNINLTREAVCCCNTSCEEKKGKGSFYIAQYPVRWTAQSASHVLPSLTDLFIPTPFSASPGSMVVILMTY